ncbi:regulatory LacI family protein [Streptomyces sp. Ag109_G2-6]|uniref:LacI family DNA-binding transcriptional regulator n=1 Tax=Streptomyces TaxID=1883 RepID=UPI0009A4CE72|nr:MULTISPECIES: LacI family DNA-binding transcriptional regulator [Streptomyces]RPF45091.1 regulatory LacI family protein [Streptomyces sp. Ag109_G2-6]
MARRPTIKDIARQAGVSESAVSFALNGKPGVSEDTRARIRGVAQELGWQPNSAARALSGERSGAVGLVLARPAHTLGAESFFLRLVSGIQEVLSAAGTALLFQVVEDVEAECAVYRRWWAERRVDGVLVVDPRTRDPRPALLTGLGLPAVVIGGGAGTPPDAWDPEGAGGPGTPPPSTAALPGAAAGAAGSARAAGSASVGSGSARSAGSRAAGSGSGAAGSGPVGAAVSAGSAGSAVPVADGGAWAGAGVGTGGGAAGLSAVRADDARAMTEVLEHLHALGHRRIVHIAGLPGLAHTARRVAALRAEADRLGLPPGRVRSVPTDYSDTEGAAATRRVLAEPEPPTALVYDNDVMAVAGSAVAAGLGIPVPGRLSIVAWDDSALCRVTHPPLTALVRDTAGFGRLAAEELLHVLAGGPPRVRESELPRLEPRGSTAPPPAAY